MATLCLKKESRSPLPPCHISQFMKKIFYCCAILLGTASVAFAAPEDTPEGFTSLFDGKDLSSWVIPEGDNGHWKVLDGVIDYDAQSEATDPKNKNLWTKKEYEDFELRIDWRIKETTGFYDVPYVLPDGSYVKDENLSLIHI